MNASSNYLKHCSLSLQNLCCHQLYFPGEKKNTPEVNGTWANIWITSVKAGFTKNQLPKYQLNTIQSSALVNSSWTLVIKSQFWFLLYTCIWSHHTTGQTMPRLATLRHQVKPLMPGIGRGKRLLVVCLTHCKNDKYIHLQYTYMRVILLPPGDVGVVHASQDLQGSSPSSATR